jgi:class 3 adenylate cyclase
MTAMGYTSLLRRFAKFARVVTFDRRGQGLSDRLADVPSLEKRIDDVRAIMDTINSKRAALVGFSGGAATSVMFATTYPDRVSHVVLFGGLARPADEYPSGDHAFRTGDIELVAGDIEEFVTGHRRSPESDLDRILATVLFTDIVDSTNRAAQLGDNRWRDLLDRHDDLSNRIVSKHRGNLVKSTGDGILATFDGPGRAVRCALTLSEATKVIGLPVRAGLHCGEVEVRGNDIGGIAVHAAARVMAHSGSNEVLVSRVVMDLVAGTDLRFSERGSYELKGLPGKWDLFAASN